MNPAPPTPPPLPPFAPAAPAAGLAPGGDLARGFYLVFWGLLLMVSLLMTHATLEVFHGFRVPAYVLGSLVLAWGVSILKQAGPPARHWQIRVRLTLGLVLLQIYFAPFTVWWREAPQTLYFFVNVWFLLLTTLLGLLMINVLAALTAQRVRNRDEEAEAWLFAAGVVVLMIVPLLMVSLAGFLISLRDDTSFAAEVWSMVDRVPPWLFMTFTLPCSLTLVSAWKAGKLARRFSRREAA